MDSLDAIEGKCNAWIKILARKETGSIIIEVQDSGEGIPVEVRDQLFKKTIMTKGVGRGTGLGLRITKQIVEAFGGTIAIDSSRSYTCFVISFPDLAISADAVS